MATKQELKAERGTKKRAVTVLIRRIEGLLDTNAPLADIEDKQDLLNTAFDEFLEAHEAYEGKIDDETTELEASNKYYAEVRKSRADVLNVIQSRLAKVTDSNTDTSSKTAQGVTREEMCALMNLPKLTLEPFEGDPLKYHAFMEGFEQVVGSLPGDDSAKLLRLLEYTVGAAREAIRRCPLIGGQRGYDKAKAILKTRFGDDYTITQKLIEELKNGKAVRGALEFRRFADDLSNGYEVLSRMRKLTELDTQSAILEMMGRFPPYVQHRWKKVAMEMRRKFMKYPTLHEFVEFVEEMAAELNDPVYGKVDRRRGNSHFR